MQRELNCQPLALAGAAAGLRGARRHRRPWPLLSWLRAIWETLPEAHAARRRYEHLLSRGVAHDAALRMAMNAAPGRAAGCRARAASKPDATQRAFDGLKSSND